MRLHCDIHLPASKSECHRALMIAAYGGFAPAFQKLSDSHDTQILMKVLGSLLFIDSLRRTFPRGNDMLSEACKIV